MRKPVVRLPVLHLVACISLFASATAFADITPQSLPFNQTWSNSALITTANNWSGVPGIIGANGANPASTTIGVDPQILIFEDPTPTLSVNANQTVVMSTMLSGELAEFETPGVVAFQGSGTADAPYLLVTINTTGRASIPMSYNLRDIDDGVESAIQADKAGCRSLGIGAVEDAAVVADQQPARIAAGKRTSVIVDMHRAATVAAADIAKALSGIVRAEYVNPAGINEVGIARVHQQAGVVPALHIGIEALTRQIARTLLPALACIQRAVETMPSTVADIADLRIDQLRICR